MEDFIVSCFIILIVSPLLINHYYSSRKRKNILPPQADGGWPVIGHLRLLSGPDPPHITLSAMADRFGPVFTLRLGVHRALILSTWESAKECFTTTNDVVFSNRPKTAAIRHMGYDFAMFGFCPYGPYWREMRKVSALRLLSTAKVAAFGPAFEAQARALSKKLHERGRNKAAPVEMKRVLGDTSLDLMVKIVSGSDSTDVGKAVKLREGIREFFRMMETLTLPDVLPFINWWPMDLFFRGAIQSFKTTGRKMDSVLQLWLEDHKRRRMPPTEGGFMGEMMVEAEKLAEEFPQYDAADTINKATCQTMILGGTDTMTVTLTWALSLLLNHPDAMRIARRELDRHVGQGRLVKVSDIKNLVYTEAIIKETLRFYPPAVLTPPRESSEDCTVAGYHVPAGTHLIVNLWKLHRDPRVWDHPLEFRPERFVTGRNKEVDVTGHHFEFLPFGGGRRICPGVSFAMQLTLLMLASLLHGFDFETSESGQEPAVDMTGSLGATNMKAAPLEVVLTPRLSDQVYD